MQKNNLKTSDLINLSKFPTPEYCSLFDAVCYIAFGERPLEEKYSKLCYPDRTECETEEVLYYATVSVVK